MKTQGTPSGEIDVKRFHFEGVSLVGKCPNCKTKIDEELDGDFIAYPSFDELYEYPYCCDECELEFSVLLEFSMKVKAHGLVIDGP